MIMLLTERMKKINVWVVFVVQGTDEDRLEVYIGRWVRFVGIP